MVFVLVRQSKASAVGQLRRSQGYSAKRKREGLMTVRQAWSRLWLATAFALLPFGARAELAVSANDNKAVLENGVIATVSNAEPDTVSIIDLSASPPKLLVEIPAPASVVGPPGSVAIAPDESFALVTGGMKLDPDDPKKMVPDDKVSVIDLKAQPPKVVQTIAAGKGAAGISVNQTGTLALVANRNEGTVSVFTIADGKLKEAGKVALGDDKSGPSQPVFTRDGSMALVTRDNDHKISMLTLQDGKAEYAKRDINAALRPTKLTRPAPARLRLSRTSASARATPIR